MTTCIEKNIRLNDWIDYSTAGATSVVELGAGFFNRLSAVNDSVSEKIGIEIWKPYIDNAKYNDCIKIEGDALDYRKLLVGYEPEICMLIDILEHFDKKVAIDLIASLKKDFEKIILMIPCGLYAQNKDVTGYGAHNHQTHRSYWYDDDILSLGFQENIKDSTFHVRNVSAGHDTACYFCRWSCDGSK